MTVELKHMPGLTPPITIDATLNELADDGWRLIQILEKHHYPPLGILERASRVPAQSRTLETREL
jgi:hypothetical protein